MAPRTQTSKSRLQAQKEKLAQEEIKQEMEQRLKPSCPRHWSAEEDELLRAAVGRFGARHWKTIATYVPSRTHTQCLQRWNKVLKPGLLKGPWSPEEDHLLRRLVEQSMASLRLNTSESCDSMHTDMDTDSVSSGDGSGLSGLARRVDWVLIAENIPGRSVKQCRERWCSNLDPAINKGVWTAEEDATLLSTQSTKGNCWAHIARLLPGRTEHAVKTRFRSIQRARRREWSKEEDDLLINQYQIHGSQWALVADPFRGTRTKNAVMTRFKQLQSLGLVQPSRRSRSVVPRARMTTAQPVVSSSSLPYPSASASAVYSSQPQQHQQHLHSPHVGLEVNDLLAAGQESTFTEDPSLLRSTSTGSIPRHTMSRIASLSSTGASQVGVDSAYNSLIPTAHASGLEPYAGAQDAGLSGGNSNNFDAWSQPRIQNAISKLMDSTPLNYNEVASSGVMPSTSSDVPPSASGAYDPASMQEEPRQQHQELQQQQQQRPRASRLRTFDSMQEVENCALQMLASQKRSRSGVENEDNSSSSGVFGFFGLESDQHSAATTITHINQHLSSQAGVSRNMHNANSNFMLSHPEQNSESASFTPSAAPDTSASPAAPASAMTSQYIPPPPPPTSSVHQQQQQYDNVQIYSHQPQQQQYNPAPFATEPVKHPITYGVTGGALNSSLFPSREISFHQTCI